jgi:adenine-specific DNA-methyltransferase
VHEAYVTDQLIAYIGNKRRLLPFFNDVFAELEELTPIRNFLDPFAGSGAVSRLAKSRGYRVFAGDLEEYSRLLVSASVIPSPEEAEKVLVPFGGLSLYSTLQRIGEQESPALQPYISRYYAPASTEHADYRRERLFYTRENALFIDRVREHIETLIPGNPTEPNLRLAKDLMIAPLLYEAATKVNTSGVFKACHKGFGGHGRDALKRITSPLRLSVPPLINGPSGSAAFRCDAARLLSEHPFDLCYIDPPYNQHQYGSNYHLLNTIALWDKPPIGNELDATGHLIHKAGIRSDWKATRSAFCSKSTVAGAFRELMELSHGRLMAFSYSSDGIFPLEELFDLLSQYGSVSVYSSDYTVYRGGRQSPTKSNRNIELLFVVDRSLSGSQHPSGHRLLQRLLLLRKIESLLSEAFVPQRLISCFRTSLDRVELRSGLSMKSDRLYRFTSFPGETLDRLTDDDLRQIAKGLDAARCRDRAEEAGVLRRLISEQPKRGDERRLISCLRKMAHKKYRALWKEEVAKTKGLIAEDPIRFSSLERELSALEALAHRRFSG